MEYLKLWKNQLDKLQECTLEEKGLILDACIAYSEGKEPSFPDGTDGRFLRLLWLDFKAMLDANSRRQEANEQNGRNGGRPTLASKPRSDNNPQKPNENPAKPSEPKKQETECRKQEEGDEIPHTQETVPPSAGCARARPGGYIDPGGVRQPARYDAAWQTSDRARSAVAQRVLDGLQGKIKLTGNATDSDLHSYIVSAMRSGIPPETIEDIGNKCRASPRFLAELTARMNIDTRRPLCR